MSNGPASLAGRRLEALRAVPRLRALRAVPRSLPALSPRVRRRLLLILVVCLTLAVGYQFWLRNSSLVAVDEVRVSGLTAANSERVRIALAAAARDMTTLNVDDEKLDRAVAAYPFVRALKVSTDFPHRLQVRVIEHHAAALAVSDTGKLPVAGDGTILRGLPVEGSLPTVAVEGVLGGERLRDPTALASAAVAGAAPYVLRRRIDEVVKRSDQGLAAELSDGPELIFGNARRLRAKWAAAARVLADPEASGASYIDLRIPGRPAAGGLPATTVDPLAPAGLDLAGVDPATTGDPAAADLPATAGVDPGTAGVDPTTGLPLAGAPATAGTSAPGAVGVTTTPPGAPAATTTPPPASSSIPSGAEGGVTAPTAP